MNSLNRITRFLIENDQLQNLTFGAVFSTLSRAANHTATGGLKMAETPAGWAFRDVLVRSKNKKSPAYAELLSGPD